MPRNKSQRELETERELRKRLRVYAEAVQWLENELKEAVAEVITYEENHPPSVPGAPVKAADIQIAPHGIPLLGYGIKAPPTVIQAIDDAPYDLYL